MALQIIISHHISCVLFNSKSLQIGVMLRGTMVDNCVLGSPAYNSGRISHGDMILKIDGTAVTSANIQELLLGNDKPGSSVRISLAKGGQKVGRAPTSKLPSVSADFAVAGASTGGPIDKDGDRKYC